MYKAFQKEHYGRDTLNTDKGFIVYEHFDDGSLYIHVLFIKQEFRSRGSAKELEQILIDRFNPSSLHCYVDTTGKNPEQSMQAILGVGYKIQDVTNDRIILKKER